MPYKFFGFARSACRAIVYCCLFFSSAVGNPACGFRAVRAACGRKPRTNHVLHECTNAAV
ncbi:hypothetical protein PF005_g17719 [Phytophthora fragariae]|uniref:Secreted protein n=2 Tax=Phytophthora TaxID=4783 RepID=A0A6A3HY40_9STRA|nr:hypothetical protein PF003_g5131 [Phytophthora fragariae]KAE9032070.1 hypothetical protein PR001_g10768 [Phytophthora rubi]KAE8931066.1 hypothetical protein PF009_g18864 [Phytophthora fragariae]KAE8974900.1 hypothetical protein PF011_g24682 [Phytophthora fragariae]KAE9089915.1 hypothetical protein PF007_g19439 [Phytophthora fragariae]